jgi:two-component system chemotaxis response regulator CheB
MKKEEPWVLAIGASGSEGIADIRALLRELPPMLPVIVLVVLHRPWGVVSTLRGILAKDSSMPVVEAETGEKFVPGTVYVGMPDQHLTLVERSFGILIGDPHRDHGNRTVDLLFKSVARFGGERMIGVVLSGSLDDGSRGLAAINHAGGHVMVIDHPAEDRQGKVRGMPENAAAYDGPIDCTGNAQEIADAIITAVHADRSSPT